jgi:hypothetical protein
MFVLTGSAMGQTIRFTDVTSNSNIAAICGGMNWTFDILMADFDGDGRLDILALEHNDIAGRLAMNNGDGTFTGIPLSQGMSTQVAMAADYNNDGRLDIAWSSGIPGIYRNDGNRQFTFQSFNGGFSGMAWADWNADGLPEYAGVPHNSVDFYKNTNLRDNQITITLSSFSPATGFLMSGYFADLNGDGWPDLVVQPFSGGQLFEFTQHTTGVCFHNGVRGTGANFNAPTSAGLDSLPAGGMTFGDIDNDGDLDAFGMGTAATGGPTNFQTRLFRNNGQGAFTEITGSGLPTASSSIDIFFMVYLGSALADFDNDGLQDLIWVTPSSIQIYRNLGSGSFQNTSLSLTMSGGGGRPARFYVADYNNDGKQDFVLASGGDPDNIVYLYQNTSANANHWLKVALKGTTLKTAIGSRIYVYEAGHLGDPTYLLGYRQVIQSHSHRQPLEQHFGLGGATTCDLRAIFYPESTVVDKPSLAADQQIVLDQTGSVKTEARSAKRALREELSTSQNPFRTVVSFLFTAGNQKALSELHIYDLAGKCVAKLNAESNSSYAWNAAKIPAGVYLARLQVGDKTYTQRLMLTK